MGHIEYMKRALEISKHGYGYTNPNPNVGCVIVKMDEIISSGYHQIYGASHAEVNAINSCKQDLQGATMYVTLEPCSHFGKTPPCVNAIIASGISRVYISMLDPNPLVSGRGVEILKNAGIDVHVGLLEDEARRINEVFVKYIARKIPYVTLKSAITLDGKICTKSGDSKWISNSISRQHTHHLRHKNMAIMVGINTVLEDNPSLNTRIDDDSKTFRNPIKIVIDSKLRIPTDSKILTSSNAQTIVATTSNYDKDKRLALEELGVKVVVVNHIENKVNLNHLMEELGSLGIDSILLEGGGTLAYGALESNIVDKVELYIAPKIFGGQAKSFVSGVGVDRVDDAFRITNSSIEMLGDDIHLTGYVVQEVN
jgi:diaminohydroxyphosphoribosylaminopyrimidine deaminase/5-amino-6-(5-phosphoribosylamino)uracil reductase